MNLDFIAFLRKEIELRNLTEEKIKKTVAHYRENESFKDRVFSTLLVEFMNSEKPVVFNKNELLESYEFVRDLLIGAVPTTFSTTDLQNPPTEK